MSLEQLKTALSAIPADELVSLFMTVRQTEMPLSLFSWLEHALLAEMDAHAGRRAAIPGPQRVVDAMDIAKSVLVLAAIAGKLRLAGLARSAEFVEAAAQCLKPPPIFH